MATIDQLKWASLTAAVNEIKSPNQFLRRLLFPADDPQHTEDIEISVISRGREIAPFVRKNGEALMAGGHDETFQTVSPTNIRLKRPFKASELLYGRRPGTVIFPDQQEQVDAILAHIARDLQGLADMVTNAEEWLAAMAVQGTITYEVADGDVFQITYPKSGTHNVTLSTFWNDADLTKPRPLANIHLAKRLISDDAGLAVTDCVLGTEASDALMELVETGNVKMLGLDGASVSVGDYSFVEQFRNDGAMFLGRIGGVRFWEYGRTAKLNGVSQNMIRPKYAEFFAVTPAAERIMYYGAIPDMAAFQGKLYVGRRFSKSWEQNDPSAIMSLIHSRPLPVPRRPDAMVSMKVVSG